MTVRLPDTIGASEISALFGCNPFMSHYGLWCLKTGLWVEEERDEAMEARLEIGRQLERPVLEIWADREGLNVVHNVISSLNYKFPGSSATPDGHVYILDDVIATVDVKTIRPHERREWALTGTPLHYRWQQQQQMMIDEVDTGYLVGLFGVDDIAHEVHRADPLMYEQIQERTHHFWRQVRGDEAPPEPDDHRATLAALMARQRERTTIVLPPAVDDLRTEWRAQKKIMNAAEKKAKALKAKIIAALGVADAGAFADGSGFSIVEQSRVGYWAKPSVSKQLKEFKGADTEEGEEQDE
jgi:predicted phage-related endonuclease